MIDVPELIMIGGNSRNCGKTTMACSIIRNLSATNEVIGLKVTCIRPGEEEMHGNHEEDQNEDFTVTEELDRESHKDTSKMLRAGAARVYYIRVADIYIEQAVLHFLSKYINKQVIVCESRSLRNILNPGLFLMMIRDTAPILQKDVQDYLPKADKIFYYSNDISDKIKFAEDLEFENGKFVLNDKR